MTDTTTTTPNIMPVIALHRAAEALAEAEAATTPEGLAAYQHAEAEALATRATSPAEVGYRIARLRDTLAQEDASDLAHCLLDAIAADLREIGAVG